ncbi:MAG: hypothetical protein V9G19_11425 [Tetrasphaera sp.]
MTTTRGDRFQAVRCFTYDDDAFLGVQEQRGSPLRTTLWSSAINTLICSLTPASLFLS